MALLTLLDIKKIDAGIGFDIINEVSGVAPELRVIPADTIIGTDITLTVRTGLPTVGFRNFNEGTARSKASYANKVFQTMIIDHQVGVDKQIVMAAKDPVRVYQDHMAGAVEAAFRTIGTQFYYGTTNDAKGFPGLIAQYPAAATHWVDATSSSSDKTSVWFVRVARETLQFIFGSGTTINMQPDWKEETLYDASSNAYQGMTNWLTGRVGLRLANKNAVVRIKNVGLSSGKTLTDAHMCSAYAMFVDNLGYEPTHIFMNSRSRGQLQAQRTATTTTGEPAPLPTNWNGIPIVISSMISNNESI